MNAPRARLPGETVFVALLLAFSVFLFWQATRISGFSALSSPGSFPMAATAIMVIAGAVALVGTLRLPAPDASLGGFRERVLPKVVGLFLGLVLVYGVVLEPVGFVLASLAFLFAAILLLHRKGPVSAFGYALVMIAAIYIVFRLIFSVVLPEGVLPERRLLALIGDWLSGRGAK